MTDQGMKSHVGDHREMKDQRMKDHAADHLDMTDQGMKSHVDHIDAIEKKKDQGVDTGLETDLTLEEKGVSAGTLGQLA